uniref:Uncharacterized protein n=2 Tax=Sus scrofa TaxID=9823 RepID=A0A4X1VHV7_PIG
MKLFVHAQELHTLEVTGQETVAQIKALSTLKVAGRMLGGKVCGSLACAGQVRGQTPTGAKQDKKKKKTGRTNIVSVVPTFGKKKGPNANS